MSSPFNPAGRAPNDRYFSDTSENEKFPSYFVSLGAHSYVVSSDIETYHSPVHIAIGKFSSLAEKITFVCGLNHNYKNVVTTYPFDDIFKEFEEYGKTYHRELIPSRRLDNKYQIIIGNDVWIGRKATVLSGVKIGSGAIIGSEAVVGSDIPPYAIAVGNPARVVKYRFDEETIKKLMAVKWWNWDLDKICANVHTMYDVKNFLKEHYSPALETFAENSLVKEVDGYRAEGRDVYTFIGDFRSPYPLWRRVLKGMLSSKNKGAVMIFWLGAGVTDKDTKEIKKLVKKSVEPIIKFIPPIDGQIFSPQILKKSTHFITSREMITVDCLDWLYDTDIKVLSALDENIFDGEPLVDWKKIFNS